MEENTKKENIGQCIKELRQTKKLTHSELAKLIFENTVQVTKYENDRLFLILPVSTELNKALDCSIDFLVKMMPQ